MSIVHAKTQQWNPTDLQFEIVNTLDGAVKALTTGQQIISCGNAL